MEEKIKGTLEVAELVHLLSYLLRGAESFFTS